MAGIAGDYAGVLLRSVCGSVAANTVSSDSDSYYECFVDKTLQAKTADTPVCTNTNEHAHKTFKVIKIVTITPSTMRGEYTRLTYCLFQNNNRKHKNLNLERTSF